MSRNRSINKSKEERKRILKTKLLFPFIVFGGITAAGLTYYLKSNANAESHVKPNEKVFTDKVPDGKIKLSKDKEIVIAPIDFINYVEDSPIFKNVIDTPGLKQNDMPSPQDFHGAMVSSVVLNESKELGIENRIKLMPIKLNSKEFGGLDDPNLIQQGVPDIAKAIRWAVDNGANIINLSNGSPYFGEWVLEIQDALNYAHKKGVVVVVSAGNDGKNFFSYPSPNNYAISAGASDTKELNSNEGVDFTDKATGVLVNDGTTDSLQDGTSFSAPIINVKIAKVLDFISQDSELSNLITVERLNNTMAAASGNNRDAADGWGPIDTDKVIEYIKKNGLAEAGDKRPPRAVNFGYDPFANMTGFKIIDENLDPNNSPKVTLSGIHPDGTRVDGMVLNMMKQEDGMYVTQLGPDITDGKYTLSIDGVKDKSGNGQPITRIFNIDHQLPDVNLFSRISFDKKSVTFYGNIYDKFGIAYVQAILNGMPIGSTGQSRLPSDLDFWPETNDFPSLVMPEGMFAVGPNILVLETSDGSGNIVQKAYVIEKSSENKIISVTENQANDKSALIPPRG